MKFPQVLVLSLFFSTEAFLCRTPNNSPRSTVPVRVLQQVQTSLSKSKCQPNNPTRTFFLTKAIKDDNNSNSDFDGFSNEDVEAANDLAKEFYQQIKRREQQQQQQQQQLNQKQMKGEDEEETWEMNQPQKEEQQQQTPKRKFTGRFTRGELDSTGTPSAGLFATQNGTVYAMPASRRINIGTASSSSRNNDRLSPREQMMSREFNLVSLASNELTLIVQGVLVMVILTFAIYIGATGGITDGSDRFGAAEGYINEYNGLGESVDFSSYTNDDSSTITNQIKDGLGQSKDDSSVWL